MSLFPSIVEDIVTDYCWEFSEQYISEYLAHQITANGIGKYVWFNSSIGNSAEAFLYPVDVVSEKQYIGMVRIANHHAMAIASNGECYFIAPDHLGIHSFMPLDDITIVKRATLDRERTGLRPSDIFRIDIDDNHLAVSILNTPDSYHFSIESDGHCCHVLR